MGSMETLVTGGSGLVGSRFVELTKHGDEIITPTSEELDITDINALRLYFSSHSIRTIVNFAAYTNVGLAEKMRRSNDNDCYRLNVVGPQNLAVMAEQHYAKLIQISTQMVFSGETGPYDEYTKTEKDDSKLTYYGLTKREGEKAARLGTIVRINHPVRAKHERLDCLRTPLRKFDEGTLYPIVIDQNIKLTFIDELVAALDIIIERPVSGIFHVATPDVTTPLEIISYFIGQVRGQVDPLPQTTLEKLNNPLRYNRNSSLDATHTEKVLGLKFSDSKTVVDKLVAQGV